MIGFKPLEAKQFRVGLGKRSKAQGALTNEGATLGAELDVRGIKDRRKQVMVFKGMQRKFEEEEEEYDQHITRVTKERDEASTPEEKRKKDEEIADLTKRKKKLTEAKKEFASSKLGTATEKIREFSKLGITAGGETEEFLAGTRGTVSVTGEVETPAQKALREQMERLEKTERDLADVVMKRVQQENKDEQDVSSW